MSESRPRILFVGPMLGRHPGWVPNPAERLAPRLEQHGYQCSLVSDELYRFHRLAHILGWVARHHRQFDLICLQVYSGLSFLVEDAVSLLAKVYRKPVVMVLHGGDMPRFMSRFPAWTTRVLRRAAALVVPSNYLRTALQEYGFVPHVIPNGIDLEDYPYRHRSQPEPHFLWMRTFHEIYNPLLAVEAFHLVKQAYPNACLTMAGQDKGQLATVKQRVESLGLQKSVRFAGFLDMEGKQREFSGHDIFLNTNRVDNMPVSIVEAAASGMLIVATAVGGLPALLEEGVTGILTPDNDVRAMALASLSVLEEPGLACKLSMNARKLGQAYDWSGILEQWDRLFQGLSSS